MRVSKLFGKTLRELPAEADSISHQLLLRSGMIHQVAAGVYSYLPLGWRVLRKIEQIIREEMDAADGQEILMPALQPFEVWEETGRDLAFGESLFTLKDRRGRKLRTFNEDHRFSFACDQCGRCCHGADISLNPYDILKISDYYGITTREFLEDFTRWAVASASGIPMVFLKTQPSCPFNRVGLCNVYQVRPFLCRSYPVIRIVTYNPSTGKANVKYSLEKKRLYYTYYT